MSFAFGFSNDDISDDELSQSGHEGVHPNPLQGFTKPDFHPEAHSLQSILTKLQDVRVSFDNYITPEGGIVTYRRELFDIKHQVMTDDNPNGLVNDVLMGADTGLDLKKSVYEGGFKSWECSYDLVDALAHDKLATRCATVLELGCGTSLPSCQLLLQRLSQEDTSQSLTLILSDFNLEVIQLVSVPNLIIHWASTLDPQRLQELCIPSLDGDDDVSLPNNEIILTSALLTQFQHDLEEKQISLKFISGSWGQEFVDLLPAVAAPVDLILSSETIYSLETLPVVAEIVLNLVDRPHVLALVAAKNFYFGVGGSVAEFVSYIERRKAEQELPIEIKVAAIASQLKRSLINIAHNAA